MGIVCLSDVADHLSYAFMRLIDRSKLGRANLQALIRFARWLGIPQQWTRGQLEEAIQRRIDLLDLMDS
jgi:hypothetical protein